MCAHVHTCQLSHSTKPVNTRQRDTAVAPPFKCSLMIVSVRVCVRRRGSMWGRGWGGGWSPIGAEGAHSTIVPARAQSACVWVRTSPTSLSCRSPPLCV
eukprot:760818-Prymnesium_polylepis.1